MYAFSGWSLGDLVGSSWVNIHTHEVVGPCRVDLDRFGQPQLFFRIRSTLTLWLKVDGVSRPVIEHWDRWDVMGHEEQAHRAALRVVRLQQNLTQRRSIYPLSCQAIANELKVALQRYDSLSNGAVIPLEVLNAGRVAGEQLALL